MEALQADKMFCFGLGTPTLLNIFCSFLKIIPLSSQSVPNWLKLELAQAKKIKLDLAWLGDNVKILALLGLKWIWNFRAEPGSGSEQSDIFKLRLARAQGESNNFELDPYRNI